MKTQIDESALPEVPHPSSSQHSGKKRSLFIVNNSRAESIVRDRKIKKSIKGFHSDQPNTITVQKTVLLVNYPGAPLFML